MAASCRSKVLRSTSICSTGGMLDAAVLLGPTGLVWSTCLLGSALSNARMAAILSACDAGVAATAAPDGEAFGAGAVASSGAASAEAVGGLAGTSSTLTGTTSP